MVRTFDDSDDDSIYCDANNSNDNNDEKETIGTLLLSVYLSLLYQL